MVEWRRRRRPALRQRCRAGALLLPPLLAVEGELRRQDGPLHDAVVLLLQRRRLRLRLLLRLLRQLLHPQVGGVAALARVLKVPRRRRRSPEHELPPLPLFLRLLLLLPPPRLRGRLQLSDPLLEVADLKPGKTGKVQGSVRRERGGEKVISPLSGKMHKRPLLSALLVVRELLCYLYSNFQFSPLFPVGSGVETLPRKIETRLFD